jgi:hypothetical protein
MLRSCDAQIKKTLLINGRTQPVGRPLAASEAQVHTVRKLHEDGMSLRDNRMSASAPRRHHGFLFCHRKREKDLIQVNH